MTKELIAKPYLPRLNESREQALARVREEHGTPKIGWEDRPVQSFEDIAEEKPLMERARNALISGSKKVAMGATVLAVGYAGAKVVGNSIDRNLKFQDQQVQPYQDHARQMAQLRQAEEQVQEHANTTSSP